MTAYHPLHGPEDAPPVVLSVDICRRTAREMLDHYAGTNIHDHGAMVQAASALEASLRSLVAALDAERGGAR